MLYAILAYHVEADVMSWTKQEDAAVMENLRKAHERVNQAGRLGPAARLGATAEARTLRGPGKGTVIDGPFAETKEHLLGFYVLDWLMTTLPSKPRANCVAPIQPRSTRSAPWSPIFPALAFR